MVSPKKIAGTSDEAVVKATGKGWSQWLAVLDRKKATQLSHREIGQFLREKHKLSLWWAQKISVGYEQERGMRVMHEQPEGFEISKSKTLPISPMTAFKAWNDKAARDKWLGESITIRKATPAKSMRITWPDKTHVDVNFYDKGENKCQVSVQHTRLSNATQAEKMKKYWSGKLENFKDFLEK
ncbi:MAG: DUF4287 domain-containing protein [Candidatus Zixiibacteriota bacterium]|nr:MAG: DUF4287 domain-containing protein [candidate division Zixibacteria bacterium]